MHMNFGDRYGPSTMGTDTYWQYDVCINGKATGLTIWGLNEEDAAERLVQVAQEGFLHRVLNKSF